MGKTGAVRKILQSQKTFANHLDDFVASQAAEAQAAAIAANSSKEPSASSLEVASGGQVNAFGCFERMRDF